MKVTNANFTKDELFRTRCEIAGVEVTKLQASKYRRGIGRAVKVTTTQLNQHLINKKWKEE